MAQNGDGFFHGSKNALKRFLLIGVKSSVNSFEYRQAVRRAWANGVDNSDVCVYFLIGGVNATAVGGTQKAKRLELALKNEQRVYNDLLLQPDLPVVDSYYTLVQKTSKFMKYAVANFNFDYLMICDDDVFVDVDYVS